MNRRSAGCRRDVMVDNASHWSGDHCMDHEAVPGVLLSSRPLKRPAPSYRHARGGDSRGVWRGADFRRSAMIGKWSDGGLRTEVRSTVNRTKSFSLVMCRRDFVRHREARMFGSASSWTRPSSRKRQALRGPCRLFVGGRVRDARPRERAGEDRRVGLGGRDQEEAEGAWLHFLRACWRASTARWCGWATGCSRRWWRCRRWQAC